MGIQTAEEREFWRQHRQAEARMVVSALGMALTVILVLLGALVLAR